MARARRRWSRSYAGKKGGRRFFWFRLTPFGMALVESSTATHSALLISESSWQDPQANLNEQVRGGPRLERLIVDYGLSVEGTPTFWSTAGNGNLALIPEFMVWKQSDQFASVVTDSTSFDATRQDQRIIMDAVPVESENTHIYDSTSTGAGIRSVRGRYSTKTKVRLGDGSLGCAWRGLFNTASGGLLGYTDWFRPTLLISLP